MGNDKEKTAVDKQNRQERRKAREERKKRNRPARIRLIPIWLRLVIVTIIFSLSLISGAVIGYGVVGNGKPADALKKETWVKIYDIIYKEIDTEEDKES